MKTKQETISRIEELVGQVTARFGAEDEAERQWLLDQCSPAASRVIEGLSVLALHLIEEIPGEDSESSINVVGLSRATGVPKGTVSKTIKRLVCDGVVARHGLPENRKEVHLRLTRIGEEIRRAHRSLHEQMGSGLEAFLRRYTAADLAVVTRVLDDLARMPRDGLRFRPDLLD